MRHPLMLLIICTKYGKNPSWTVDATEQTRDAGRTDVSQYEQTHNMMQVWTGKRTDGQTDGRSETNIPPNNFVVCGV